jgi:hypothetical protein
LIHVSLSKAQVRDPALARVLDELSKPPSPPPPPFHAQSSSLCSSGKTGVLPPSGEDHRVKRGDSLVALVDLLRECEDNEVVESVHKSSYSPLVDYCNQRPRHQLSFAGCTTRT